MKRALVVLLMGLLLLSAAPVGAATAWEIRTPTEKETVSGTVEILLPPSEEYVGATVQVAHGFDAADRDFRQITCLNRILAVAGGPFTCQWATDGFSSGPYTVRVGYLQMKPTIGTAIRWDGRLSVTRNVVLDAPDRAPKLQLMVPEYVLGVAPLTAKVSDEDLEEWRLTATDKAGHEWPLASGRLSASLDGQSTSTDAGRRWPTREMVERAKATTPNLGAPDLPAILDLTQLPHGPATVKLWAADVFGNESVVERKVTVSAAPAPLPEALTIVSPADRQTVTNPFDVVFRPAAAGAFEANLEVAHGFDATTGFAWVAGVKATGSGPSGITYAWSAEGLSGGNYTLRITVLDQATRKVLSQGTRNFVLNAPDSSPKLALEMPPVLTGKAGISGQVVDSDFVQWNLELVDAAGKRSPLASYKITVVGGNLGPIIPTSSNRAPRTYKLPESVDVTNFPDGEYTIRLTATDSAFNVSVLERKVVVSNPKPEPAPAPVPAPEPDRAGPQLGAVVVAPVSGTGLSLRWEAASDPGGVAGYRVFLHEGLTRRQVADLGPDARQFAMPLQAGRYRVELQAVDQNGNTTATEPAGFEVKAGTVAIWHRGRFLAGDVPGFAEEGRTWVPLRLFSEALGYEVTWDAVNQAATLRDPKTGRTVIATVGVPALQVVDGGKQTQVEAAAPRLVGGRVLVPLRALVEALGARVQWVQETQTVELVTE